MSVLILICIVIPNGLFGGSPFQLNSTFHQFMAEEGKSNLEIFYEMDPNSWAYVLQEDGTWVGKVMLDLKILHQGQPVYQDRWAMQNTRVAADSSNSINKMDLIRLTIPTGQYDVILTAVDLHDQSRKDTSQAVLQSPPYSSRNVWLSDLVLCQELRKSKEGDPELFRKDTLFVLPRAQFDYNNQTGLLQFYVEAYSLLKGVTADTFTIRYYVEDEAGNPVASLPFVERNYPKANDRMTKWGMMALNGIPEGLYRLNVFVLNPQDELLASAQESFQVRDTRPVAQRSPVAASSDYAMLSLFPEIGVDEEIAYIQYIIDEQERRMLKGLFTQESRREFLKAFWDRRNPDVKNPRNEFRETYLQRIREADSQFGKRGLEGWKTDFGRVFMLYGKPSDMERRSNTNSGRAYQRWHYDEIQGGVEFVFMDITGVNDYRLVHSTMLGETANPNWEQELDIGNRQPYDEEETLD